jgi:hypothetical protein
MATTMTRLRKRQLFTSIFIASATAFAAHPSHADETIYNTSGDTNPQYVLQHSLAPLFKPDHTANATDNETQSFSPDLRRLTDLYFSADQNARDFDSDTLLGMQDWTARVPTLSTIVLTDTYAAIKLTLSFTKEYIKAFRIAA